MNPDIVGGLWTSQDGEDQSDEVVSEVEDEEAESDDEDKPEVAIPTRISSQDCETGPQAPKEHSQTLPLDR